MADKILEINITEYVKNAFYSLPAFTDAEGNEINGVYGAFFKLNNDMKTGEYSEIGIIDGTPEELSLLTPSVRRQVEDFFNRLKSFARDGHIAVTQELIDNISGQLLSLSPTGEVKAAPKFNCKIKRVSDLNEVESIFNNIKGTAAFYVLFDNPSKDSIKSTDGEVLGLGLCTDEEEAIFIPVENFITADYLGKKLSAISEKASLVTFDIKNSFRIFEPHDIRNSGCFDVLIGAYINNPIKNDYMPEDIAKEYLKFTLPKRSDLFGKGSLLDADETAVTDYAAKIAYICFLSEPLIRKQLVKTGMEKLFFDVEMPLSYILYSMEKEGIIARRDELAAYGEKLSVRIKELESAIYEAAGCEFNISSPKQLGEILFEKMALPAEKKTKTGYSTAADVLEKLAPEYPIVADVLEYRGLTKLKSTYADGLASFIEADGRIHTSFNQTITATGRISSTEPNLQNIPMRTELGRLIRKVFVPKEGYVFADADYSQIELRILAHMSEDQGLIDAYHEGDDIHSITASKVFHVPLDQVTPLQRRNAKAVNFGIVYGISSFGLSQDLSISMAEARDYIAKYFETYPGVKNYQEKAVQSAKENGYSVTMFGRRRQIPELKASNFNLKQFGERVAMNAPIQGTAADIMKIAMINVFFRLREEKLESRLILQIHDELVIETKIEEQEQVCRLLTEEMENAVKLAVPLEVECHVGKDWYEAK